MTLPTEIAAYLERFRAKARELNIDPLYLDAVLHADYDGAWLSETGFLRFCFLRRSADVMAETLEALQSPDDAARASASTALLEATPEDMQALPQTDLSLLANFQQKMQGDDAIRKLHIPILHKLQRDLAELLNQFGATTFHALLTESLAPHLAELVHLRNGFDERHRSHNDPPAEEEPGSPSGLPEPLSHHPPITLVLADDMTLFREGFRLLLSRRTPNQFLLIGEAATGRELMELLKTVRPDLLVIDVNIPQPNGIDTTARMKRDYPGLRVLGISHYKSPVEVELMVRAGADGFIGKDASFEELVRAIRAVYAGETFFGRSVPTQLLAAKEAGLPYTEKIL